MSMTITQDMILTADEVSSLYLELEKAKDLAIYRRSKWVHIRDHYILKVMLESGLRVFELASLQIKDFRNNVLIVQCGKFGKKREVVLTQFAQKLIREWVKVKRTTLEEPTSPDDYLFVSQQLKPYTTVGIRKRVKYWFARCGFRENFSCHTCRHSYVSHGLASGLNIIRMKENVGHSSLNTTTTYAHTVNNDLGDIEIYKRESFASNRRRNNLAD